MCVLLVVDLVDSPFLILSLVSTRLVYHFSICVWSLLPVDLVDLLFSKLSPFWLRIFSEYVCALSVVDLVDLTFLILSLFLPRLVLSLLNMCMVAFAS